MALPVNFKDDVLASSMDGKRRYNMITNSDGTVSFEDVTTYSQEGSNFGSAQINNTNGAINTINNNVLDTIEQISANTSSGKFAGALALKNVNNSFQASFEYSTDERIVGTWIDGSPIYRKVFTGTITQSSADVVIGNIPSSKAINIYGVIKTSNNEYLPLTFVSYVSGQFYYNHTFAKSNGDVCIFTGWPGPYNCIVEYIK